MPLAFQVTFAEPVDVEFEGECCIAVIPLGGGRPAIQLEGSDLSVCVPSGCMGFPLESIDGLQVTLPNGVPVGIEPAHNGEVQVTLPPRPGGPADSYEQVTIAQPAGIPEIASVAPSMAPPLLTLPQDTRIDLAGDIPPVTLRGAATLSQRVPDTAQPPPTEPSPPAAPSNLRFEDPDIDTGQRVLKPGEMVRVQGENLRGVTDVRYQPGSFMGGGTNEKPLALTWREENDGIFVSIPRVDPGLALGTLIVANAGGSAQGEENMILEPAS